MRTAQKQQRTRSDAHIISDSELLRVREWIEEDAVSLRECARRMGI